MFHKRAVRKASCLITAALLSAAALTGCAVGDGPGADRLSKEPVSIRLTWWGGDKRQQLTQQAVELFEKKHPNIDVELEFSDWTGYWDRLATMSAGGNSPDVMQMDQLYLASYADRGALLDLERSKYFKKASFDPGILKTGRSGGTLYAAPHSVTTAGVLVNTTILDRLGLELPDTTSWTWDQFSAFSRKVSEKSGGKVSGSYPMGGLAALELYARQHGEAIFGEDGSVAVDPKTVEGLWAEGAALMKADRSISPSAVADASALPLEQSPLATGKVAMSVAYSSQLPAYAAASGGDKFAVVNLPSDQAEPFQFIKPGMYWSISSQSQHPAESALLINFLVGDPDAAKILGVERGIPAVQTVRQGVAPDLAEDDRTVLTYLEWLEDGRVAGSPAVIPNGASNVEQTLARYNQEVVFGRMGAHEAATGFVDEMTDMVESAR
ncbi:ABC transporter substrate-binding protein [Streptomyces sp. NPDC060209]|uniref:ABC transporter substrate-binding protein n=1 Tax=Streptomyces sp. NPDC060209 TaxID=3347073 RepID=UPI0036506DBF